MLSELPNSYIEVRVHITNNNNVNTRLVYISLGPIINSDDGPIPNSQSISPLITNETEFDQPGFEAFK